MLLSHSQHIITVSNCRHFVHWKRIAFKNTYTFDAMKNIQKRTHFSVNWSRGFNFQISYNYKMMWLICGTHCLSTSVAIWIVMDATRWPQGQRPIRLFHQLISSTSCISFNSICQTPFDISVVSVDQCTRSAAKIPVPRVLFTFFKN